MKLIEIIDYQRLVKLIFDAKHKLLISLPSIDTEIASALIESAKSGITKIVIDNSEESIRNGYGEAKGIDLLREFNFEVFEHNHNMVSFIISDSIGYFIFPQSKIFEYNPKGPNAFRLDPVTIQLLIQSFFPLEIDQNTLPFSQASTIGESVNYFEKSFSDFHEKDKNIIVSDFDEKKYELIQNKLKINPPLAPNLQRQINTYTAKIQFVELKFTGGNLENKIAQLPKDAIPINSDELKTLLLTRIKMFQDITKTEEHQKFNEFKGKIEALRAEYLVPITCRPNKSILNIDRKEIFTSQLDKLKHETKTLNKLLTTMLEEGKLNTTDLLRKELNSFFKTNEPQELKNIEKPDIKERKLKEIINNIVSSIKFPDISKLIESISLNELYYDLTWNDFKEEKLLNEFLKKGIMKQDEIDSIVDLKKAYETKR